MTSRTSRFPVIACFGEALWDILPRGIFLGGAPLNVGYHLSRHGVQVLPVSAVGRDFLGQEAIARIAAWGVDTAGIGQLPRVPTGTVRVALDRAGIARYRIAEQVAWDRIALPSFANRRKGRTPVAVVFGTLALRGAANRRTLDALLEKWPQAWRVLDLNLRPPFDRPETLAFALSRAQVLKLNDEELARMTKLPVRTNGQLAKAARAMSERHGIARVCVTAGARGAGLWWDGTWEWEAGRRVDVRDTVGAGDSFLAAFLAGVLGRGVLPRQALVAACRMGEFVATRDGATPPYRVSAGGRPQAE